MCTKRKVYNVSQMEAADWQVFAEYSEKYYKEHNYKRYEDLSASWSHINLLWTKIKELLITTANKTVPCSYRSHDDANPKPKSLTTCYTALKQLNRILLQFRTKFITRSLWSNAQKWAIIKDSIQRIISEHQIEPADFPPILSHENVRPVKKQLLTIYKLVYHKARLEQRLLEHKQI